MSFPLAAQESQQPLGDDQYFDTVIGKAWIALFKLWYHQVTESVAQV